jgi:hypothetical protein
MACLAMQDASSKGTCTHRCRTPRASQNSRCQLWSDVLCLESVQQSLVVEQLWRGAHTLVAELQPQPGTRIFERLSSHSCQLNL